MLVVNNYWIIQLLDGVQALQNFCILVVSVYLVNRVIQGLQVGEMLFNFREVVSSLDGVHWSL